MELKCRDYQLNKKSMAERIASNSRQEYTFDENELIGA